MANKAYYGVYIGYPTGYYSEYNNGHSALKNDKGEVITYFGGANVTEGELGHGVQNSGKGKMEVPSKIEVMWLSSAENQFWHGEFDLPKKMLGEALNNEKLLDVFSSAVGALDPKYEQIIVNVAPKGKVYVYLGGYAVKLVGIYQAKAIDYDWSQHAEETWVVIDRNDIETRDEFVKGSQSKKDYLSSLIEQNYNEGYFNTAHWKLSIKGEHKLIAYMTETINGELTHVLKNTTEEEVTNIPKMILFDYEYKNKVERLRFDLNKPYEFYKKHFNAQQLIEIIIDLPDDDNCFLYFKQGNKIVEFEDFTAQEMER